MSSDSESCESVTYYGWQTKYCSGNTACKCDTSNWRHEKSLNSTKLPQIFDAAAALTGAALFFILCKAFYLFYMMVSGNYKPKYRVGIIMNVIGALLLAVSIIQFAAALPSAWDQSMMWAINLIFRWSF